jgi:hypothetical protein
VATFSAAAGASLGLCSRRPARIADPAERPDSDQQCQEQVAICLSKRIRLAHQSADADDAGRPAAALYDYRNIEGIPNPTIYSTQYSDRGAVPADRQHGVRHQRPAQHAERNPELSVGPCLEIPRAESVVLGGFAFLGSHAHDHRRRLGQEPRFRRKRDRATHRIPGRQASQGLADARHVGYPDMQQKWAWQGYVGYRYVQRDATVDAFTDQDFHLGGTDAEGLLLGAKFAFEKNSLSRPALVQRQANRRCGARRRGQRARRPAARHRRAAARHQASF